MTPARCWPTVTTLFGVAGYEFSCQLCQPCRSRRAGRCASARLLGVAGDPSIGTIGSVRQPPQVYSDAMTQMTARQAIAAKRGDHGEAANPWRAVLAERPGDREALSTAAALRLRSLSPVRIGCSEPTSWPPQPSTTPDQIFRSDDRAAPWRRHESNTSKCKSTHCRPVSVLSEPRRSATPEAFSGTIRKPLFSKRVMQFRVGCVGCVGFAGPVAARAVSLARPPCRPCNRHRRAQPPNPGRSYDR